MQQGSLVELEITDLSSSSDGVGHWEGLAVFIPDTVPGDRVLARITHRQRQYIRGRLEKLLQASPHRIRPRCIVADKCGGCQWQHISDSYQRQAKQQQIIAALQRIGGFPEPPVAPLLFSEATLGYRNKATYPLGYSATGQVQAGYYRIHSHHLINLNQCPVQDSRLNPLLAEIKQDIAARGWTIYDETRHQGQLRHLALRIGGRTGEMLLTLVSTDWDLPVLSQQAQAWRERYPQLVGVCLNHNPHRTNTIFGSETRSISGRPYLREIFAGVELHLRPDTFFQVNTEAAEALLAAVTSYLDLKGEETLVDAYCGVGTFTLPLAKQVRQAIGIEVYAASLAQAELNARHNDITNVSWIASEVEAALPQLDVTPDIVLLDPPRQGCNPAVIEALRNLQPPRLVYISCRPSTLARDLKLLCDGGSYRLAFVQPADFFPQTAHVECAAFLER